MQYKPLGLLLHNKHVHDKILALIDRCKISTEWSQRKTKRLKDKIVHHESRRLFKVYLCADFETEKLHKLKFMIDYSILLIVFRYKMEETIADGGMSGGGQMPRTHSLVQQNSQGEPIYPCQFIMVYHNRILAKSE